MHFKKILLNFLGRAFPVSHGRSQNLKKNKDNWLKMQLWILITNICHSTKQTGVYLECCVWVVYSKMIDLDWKKNKKHSAELISLVEPKPQMIESVYVILQK